MARNTKKLEALDKEINKSFKDLENDIIRKSNAFIKYDIVPTDSVGLNTVLGNNGIPLGKLMVLKGPESCLSYNTFIPFEVYSKDDKKRINHKGGTIELLYERFTGEDRGTRSVYKTKRNNNVNFYVKSVNSENRIIRNKVIDVVDTGVKPCFKVVDSEGNIIECTEDHKFMTNNGFMSLKNLEVGSEVFIHNNTRFKGRNKYQNRPSKAVKYHPNLPIKIVDGKYTYYRGVLSRLYYESYLNDMELEDFLRFLNTKTKEEINKLKFIPEGFHIHHKDEDFNNNSKENLILIDPKKHGVIHAKDRHNNLRFMAVTSTIIRIEPIGTKKTYDIKCVEPYNNYIANKFVVHNCGKTALSVAMLADIQKNIAHANKLDEDGDLIEYGNVAIIDAEHSFSKSWYSKLGLDCSDEHLRIVKPTTGESGLEVVEKLVDSGLYDAILIDSLNALMPEVMIENDIGDATMGAQARMLSKAYGRIISKISEKKVALFAISQERNTMNAYEKPALAGGKATRFYAHIILDVRRKEYLGSKEEPIGIASQVKAEKNKVAVPFKKCMIELYFKKGFDFTSDYVNYAVNHGVITKKGGWYYLSDDIKLQGKEKVSDYYNSNPEEYKKLQEIIDKLTLQKDLEDQETYEDNGEDKAPEEVTEEDVILAEKE